MASFEGTSRSEEETVALGERLGARLQAGDFVALEGPLGAGKTRLVAGIARGLGVDPDRRVPSPTFTLVNEHPGRCALVHADLYRLEGPAALEQLGWRELLARDAVLVVEWLSSVGRDAESAPADRLEVTISIVDPATRRIAIAATGPRSAARIAGLV